MTDGKKKGREPKRHDFKEPSGICRHCGADWTDANPCGDWLKRKR